MSQKLQDKYGEKVPWLLPKSIRIPRIKYPTLSEKLETIPTPSRSITLIAIYVFLFYLTMGGIYIQIRNPIAMGAHQDGSALWLYPSSNEAFIVESIVAAAIIFLGAFGFVVLFFATTHQSNRPYAIKLIVVALVMIFISFGFLQWIIAQKTGR